MAEERTAEWLKGERRCVIAPDDTAYPGLLSDIKGAPDALYVAGNADALALPGIAIVGSRNPTRGGLDTAFRFAKHLADAGFVIVSGLAEGIDTAAHEGALDAGGRTIAVLGHGPDTVYPASNRDLAGRIACDGAIVTEYPPGAPPQRRHFPERNRIISGLALGTLVVEAARQSGSLITARHAGDQGREVFAIPGSIHNPLSRGCHQLIRQGARLVESADDIFAELAPLIDHFMAAAGIGEAAAELAEGDTHSTTKNLDEDYVRLLDTMGFDAISADEIARKSTLTIEQVSSMLLILELEGEIESLPGGKFSKLSNRDRHLGR